MFGATHLFRRKLSRQIPQCLPELPATITSGVRAVPQSDETLRMIGGETRPNLGRLRMAMGRLIEAQKIRGVKER